MDRLWDLTQGRTLYTSSEFVAPRNVRPVTRGMTLWKQISSRFFRLSLCVVMLAPSLSAADPCARLLAETNLNLDQARALRAAKPEARDLEWRVLTTEVNGARKSVVLLGEHHIAQHEDLRSAGSVIDTFEHFGTENFGRPETNDWSYRLVPLVSVMMIPGLILTALIRRSTTSPMNLVYEAPLRKTLSSVEKFHRPRWTEEIDLFLMAAASLAATSGLVMGAAALGALLLGGNPPVYFPNLLTAGQLLAGAWSFDGLYPLHRHPLVRNRDVSMSARIADVVQTPAIDSAYLVVVGQSHLKNMVEYLTTQYGFREVALETDADAAALTVP